jgi:hypothetical protein
MKKIRLKILASMIVSAALFSSCLDNPIDKEQYIQQVYLNGGGTEGNVFTQDISASAIDTTYFSVCVSGSQATTSDANVVLAENDTTISIYNYKYRFDEAYKYLKMPSSAYSYDNNVILKAGNAYARVPIVIDATKLNPDSLYMIPIKIAKCNFPIVESDSVMLFTINFVNKYSGTYNTAATYSGANNGSLSQTRTLKAIDANTVRFYMYSAANETVDNAEKYGVDMTIDPATNNVSVTPFSQCNITNGSGTYYPNGKKYVVTFTYTDLSNKTTIYNITFTKASS